MSKARTAILLLNACTLGISTHTTQSQLVQSVRLEPGLLRPNISRVVRRLLGQNLLHRIRYVHCYIDLFAAFLLFRIYFITFYFINYKRR